MDPTKGREALLHLRFPEPLFLMWEFVKHLPRTPPQALIHGLQCCCCLCCCLAAVWGPVCDSEGPTYGCIAALCLVRCTHNVLSGPWPGLVVVACCRCVQSEGLVAALKVPFGVTQWVCDRPAVCASAANEGLGLSARVPALAPSCPAVHATTPARDGAERSFLHGNLCDRVPCSHHCMCVGVCPCWLLCASPLCLASFAVNVPSLQQPAASGRAALGA